MALAGTARAVLFGNAPGGEIWESGFWLADAPVSSQSDAQTLANTVGLSIETNLLPALKGALSVEHSYTGVRLYCYQNAGTVAQYVAEYSVSNTPGTGAGLLPDQVCQVVTTLTGAAGRRNRGRMYFPAGGRVLTADHQFANADCDAMAGGTANLFRDLASLTPAVYSSKGSSTRKITLTRCDSKPDIQRRRANKQPAAYTSTSGAI